MRPFTLLVAAAALVAVASTAVHACEDAQQLRLSASGAAASRIGLLKVVADDTIRGCVEVNAGRRVDWYFTTTAAARTWMTEQQVYYSVPRSVPYPQPPSVVFQSRLGTSGFSMDFDVSADQVATASEDFSIIIHSTADCLGTGNECVVAASVHLIEPASVVVIIIIVVACIAICVSIAGCVYCCCCRNRNPPPPPEAAPGVVVVQQGQPGQQYPPPPQQQPGGYPPQQQQGYPPQQQGYPQQQPGAYPPPQQGTPQQYPPQQQGQQYPPQPQGQQYPPQETGDMAEKPPQSPQHEEQRV